MTRARTLLFALVALATCAAPVQAQVMSTQPAPLDGQMPEGTLPNRLQGQTGVIEQLGERVSPDTEFVNSKGEAVRVGDLLNQGKPVVVAFVYHSCPMLCNLILDGLADAMAESDLQPGEDYYALALSFDERDTVERAAEAKVKYVAEAGREGTEDAFHFWTGTDESIERFTSETGFGFAWDARTTEYAHSAALVFLSPDGTIARYLYGAQFYPLDFKLALVEAGEGTVGTTADRFLLTCYQFDENSQSYSLVWLGVMKWGSGALLLAIIIGLAAFWRREIRGQSGSHWDDLPHDAAPAT
ncbi:MAG: SCO family protein [Bacteroidota bacterium]